jgi:hypothetical protein
MLDASVFSAEDGVYAGNRLFASARKRAKTLCHNHEGKSQVELWERLSFLIGLPILEKLETTGCTWLELSVAEGSAGRLLDSLEVIDSTGGHPLVKQSKSIRLKSYRRYVDSGGDPDNRDFIVKPTLRRGIPLLGANYDEFMIHQLLPYPMYCLKQIRKKSKKFDLIGLYATKESAQRVLNQARFNPKVYDHVRQYAVSFDLVDTINPEDSIINSYRHITPEYIYACNSRVSEPMAKPFEKTEKRIKPERLKVWTRDLQGYTKKEAGLGSLQTTREVVEASGNLEFYIESET